MSKPNVERELAMCELYRSGKTLVEIGAIYGLSRERIRQLISKHGFDRTSGGMHAKALTNARQSHLRQRAGAERRCLKNFGCDVATTTAINGRPWSYARGNRCPAGAFLMQKKNAIKRGIEWHFTLPQWWTVWCESGKWDQRGRGQGYCMARHGDSGPYSVENVYICTIGQNFSDSYLVKPWNERFAGIHKPAVRDELGLTPSLRRVYDLRQSGLTRREIAAAMGYTIGSLDWALATVRDTIRTLDTTQRIEA